MRSRMNPGRPVWASLGVVLVTLALAGCGALLTPQYRIHRAEREMKAGQWQRAAVDLRAVVHKRPHNTQAWLLLTRLALAAADSHGAASALEHAIHAGARGPQVDDLQARTWLVTGHAKTLLGALDQHTLQVAEPQRTLLRAKALLATGKPDQAGAVLRALLAAHADLTEARDWYAQALARQGKLDAALQQLRTAARLDPKSPEPLLFEGRIDQWRGHFQAAERTLAAALKRMPPAEPVLHRVTALLALTESRLALAKIDAAAKSQARLAALEPRAPETRLLSARISLARGHLSRAINELERVVADAPHFIPARMLLGAALLQRGDPEQAQQQLREVLRRAPHNVEARKLLAQVQLKLGEPQGALNVLTPALSAQRLDPQLLALYGTAAKRTGNSQALIESLQRIVRERPKDEAAKLNLAAAYLRRGQAAQALPLLQQTRDDGNVRRDRLLIGALAAVHGQKAASSEVARLLHAHPRDAALLNLAAGYYASQGQLARARDLLHQVFSLKADDTDALINLARVEVAMGDLNGAEQRLHRALGARPHVLPIRLALVDVLLRMRQFAQARSVLKAAAAHGGTAVPLALARVALAQGDLKGAHAALDRAVATQPSNAALSEVAGLMLLRANQYSAALARFAHATQLAPHNATYWFNSARAQLALNQPLAARASLQKAEDARPHWLPVVSELTMLDVHEGKGEAALARVDALLKTDPHDPGVLALKGGVEAALGHASAAIADLSAAERLHPSPALARQLSLQLYRVKLAAHAADPQRSLERWLAREPNDSRVRDVLAGYYLTVRKSLRQAVAQYKRVIAVAPNDVLALNNLAWALNRLGDPKATEMAERAYRLAPKVASVNDTLGWILAQQGHSHRALTYLARAVKLNSHDPDLSYHYAYALVQTGQQAKARTILTRILTGSTAFQSRAAAKRLLATLKKS